MNKSTTVLDFEKDSLGNSPVIPRIYSFDTLKVLAIIGVIVFHVYPFAGINAEFYRLYRTLWGFSVPVFFIVSGYLLAMKIGNGDNVSWRFKKNLKRLFFLLIAWSSVYLTIPIGWIHQRRLGAFLAGWQAAYAEMIHRPALILGQGVEAHLWFIIALITALFIAYPFVKYKKIKMLLVLASGFYRVSLLTGAYAWSPLGFSIGFDTRNGPFIATLFVTIGVILAESKYRPSVTTASFIFASGLAIQMIEAALIFHYIPRQRILDEYYIGTIPYALGLVMLALNLPDLGKKIRIQRIGPYVLGIYMIQFIVIKYLLKINYGMHNVLWQLFYTPIVLLLSLLIAICMAKIPYVKKLVKT